MERARIIVTVLLAIAGIAAAFIGGCIRRYPAPTEPLPAPMPYSAIATWRQIQPPAADGDDPLPLAALRLAVGPTGEQVFADSALVDGRDAAVTADGWTDAWALLSPRSEPIVLLATVGALSAEQCAALAGQGDRVVVAAGVPAYGADGPSERDAVEGASRDPLSTGALSAVCP